MLLNKLLRFLPSSINIFATRSLKVDPKIRHVTGINFPPKLFKRGEEDPTNLPDEEKKVWEEQRSLYKLDARGPLTSKKRRNPLGQAPQMRGIVLKTLIKKPKKPNSANRKCVYVKLSNGKEATCFVPGIGHNLQEHSNVLVRLQPTRDVPGLRLRVIRGVYDCSLVVKQSRN